MFDLLCVSVVGGLVISGFWLWVILGFWFSVWSNCAVWPGDFGLLSVICYLFLFLVGLI